MAGKKKVHGGYLSSKPTKDALKEIERTHKEAMRGSQTPAENNADDTIGDLDGMGNDTREDWEKLMDEIKGK